MEFHEWEPIYEAILADFGYERAADEAARDWLAEHVGRFDLDRITTCGTVAIAGAGPNLERDLPVVRDADTVLAASDAGTRLAAAGIDPDLVVTDLDGDPDGTVALAREGVPVAIHAHGDNGQLLREHVPRFPPDRVLGTTQAAPIGPLYNHGGFTDGDRAAFLADELGADRLTFPGWDLDAASGEKRAKLRWAERLLRWLERRRRERFAVLDGRREEIDLSDLPAP